MRILKKLLNGFFTLMLINLIGLLVLSFNLKNIIVNGVIKEVLVDKITSQNYLNNNIQQRNEITTEENINSVTDDEQVREILRSKEVEELIDKYLDIVIDSLIDGKEIDEVALKEDIMNYIRENKDKLEKAAGKEITNEDLNRVEEELRGENVDENFKRSLAQASKSLKETEKTVLKGYKFFVSNDFRIIDILLIILDLIILAIIGHSLHKWIKSLAVATTVCGVFLILTYIIVKVIITSFTKYNFNVSSLLISGIIMTIYGILAQVIYKIVLKKIEMKKKNIEEENQNEISQVPTRE